jgi:hypothetical protein
VAVVQPLTHILLGQAKSCIIVITGFLLLGNFPGWLSLSSAVIAIISVTLYTFVNVKEVEAAKEALAIQQRDRVCSALNNEFRVAVKPETT